MPPLVSPPPRSARPLGARHPQRHAVQPRRNRDLPADRPGPAGQDQKRRLKRILGLVRITQHAPAHLEHHRPMARQQDRECELGASTCSERPAMNCSSSSESLLFESVPRGREPSGIHSPSPMFRCSRAESSSQRSGVVVLSFSSITRAEFQSILFQRISAANRSTISEATTDAESPSPSLVRSLLPAVMIVFVDYAISAQEPKSAREVQNSPAHPRPLHALVRGEAAQPALGLALDDGRIRPGRRISPARRRSLRTIGR